MLNGATAASPLEGALAPDSMIGLPGTRHGDVATYIPELGRADPEHFAICVATVDGHVYAVGDTDVPFTIQSISKPFVYGLALGRPGRRRRDGEGRRGAERRGVQRHQPRSPAPAGRATR